MTNEIEDELIDNLLKGYKKPEDLIEKDKTKTKKRSFTQKI